VKRIIPFLVTFFFCCQTYARQELRPGDRMPELVIQTAINTSSKAIRFADYRGKVLILDFWATWCTPCLAMFNKTEKLLDNLGNTVQFLPVTYQRYPEVEKTLAQLRQHKGLKLSMPMIVEDTVLQRYFPYRTLPHYVWINREGVVAAITDADAVTAENINAVSSGKTAGFTMKVDIKKPYRLNENLVSQNVELGYKPIMYQSAVTSYIGGLPSSYTVFPVDSVQGHRVVATNARIPTLYKVAYGNLMGHYFPESNILLEMADTVCCNSSLYGAPYENWLKDRGYCYELIVPAYMLGQQAEIMQADLKRFFPQYTATVEKRVRPCLVLERMAGEDKLKAKGDTTAYSFDPYGADISNGKTSVFVIRLNYYLQHLAIPIIDGTGYTGAIDLKIKANMSDPDSLRTALKKYNLALVQKEYETAILVIRDKQK
jgi:thiol-disulfide isomerase/thioredoxin